jgi:beta-glucanase (GH16 family)
MAVGFVRSPGERRVGEPDPSRGIAVPLGSAHSAGMTPPRCAAPLSWFGRLLAGGLMLGVAAGLRAQTPPAKPPALPPIADAAEAARRYTAPDWQLRWGDEFDRDGAPDPQKWDYEQGRIRNREAQFYTAGRSENARVADGHLILTARREPWLGAGYTSASVISLGRHALRYGKLEIRARLPAGRGTWPALWLLGVNRETEGWPRCGEIDLMEYVGYDPDQVHFTVHTEAFNHVKKTGVGRGLRVPRVAEEFHTYGLIWTPERIEFFFDGRKVHEFANDGRGVGHWPFDQPFYLLMNLAIGGEWGGQKGIDESIFPVEFRIDYVRFWQR